ncbi:MAG TPA: PAS domain S-box protein [Thermoanaerobaculaceae bacterium]|nr:PAS domain S-box protein [Thermoanaerobaculaceae bacterium]HRS15943.1 PAS domain S-box protein [Thermoanaerobaculaceae bacterium]
MSEDRVLFAHLPDAHIQGGLDVLPEAVFVLGLDGSLRFASHLARTFLGHEHEPLAGSSWLDYVHPDERGAVDSAMRRCAEQNGVCHVEHRLARGAGDFVWVESRGRSFADRDGAPRGFLVAVRDITERRRLQAEVEAQREYLQAVLDTMSDAVFVDDARTGQIIDVNRKMCELYGYTREEALRVSVGDLSLGEPPYSQAEALEWLRRAREEGPQRFEWLAKRKDGSLFWVEVSIAPATISGEERFVVLAHDISDRKTAEERRRQMEYRLQDEQRLQSLAVLAGGLAHDFNNLLMAISGSLDLVRLRLPQDSPAVRPIGQAKASLGRAAELTRQMLAFAGRGRVFVEPLSLSTVVEGLGALLASIVGPSVELRLHLDPAVPEIMADSAQVQQVVFNLVHNASEACGNRPGLVSVEVRCRECDESVLAASEIPDRPAPGRFVAITVADNGSGIDASIRPHLFDPFFSTRQLGRGLGLPAVHGIVRSHKGALLIESGVGWGTTVTVLFPVLEAARDAAGGADRDHTTRGVLVVEDQASVREVVIEMLEEAGYRALGAPDGQSALAVMRERGHEIDCIFLDLTMPGLDGVATLRLIREQRPEVKFVVASGSSAAEVARRFAGQDVAGVLLKPYDVQSLLDELRRVLA